MTNQVIDWFLVLAPQWRCNQGQSAITVLHCIHYLQHVPYHQTSVKLFKQILYLRENRQTSISTSLVFSLNETLQTSEAPLTNNFRHIALLQLHMRLRKQVTDCMTVISLLGGEVEGCEFCTQIACQCRVPRDVALKARHLADCCTPAVHAHTHTHGPLSMLLLCQQGHYPCTSNTTNPSPHGAN